MLPADARASKVRRPAALSLLFPPREHKAADQLASRARRAPGLAPRAALTRQPGRLMAGRTALALCLLALVSNASAFGRQLLQPIDPVYSAAVPAPWTGKGYKWGSNSSMLSMPSGMNPTNGLPVTANGPWRAGDTFVSYAPGFSSGVASGDPLPLRVILWTRFQVAGDQSAMAAADPANSAFTYAYSPAAGTVPVVVSWWVSTSPTATGALTKGTYTTDGSRDWTVKLDVNYGANYGSVTAGTTMYYGFSATYQSVTYTSPMGSFRAITTAMTTVNYAVASCSNWGFGAFNAYDMIAKVDNLDFYMHGKHCFNPYSVCSAMPFLTRASPRAACQWVTTSTSTPT